MACHDLGNFFPTFYEVMALMQESQIMGKKPTLAHGQTPAEACGIEIKGENIWMTLIQNASKN